MTTVLHVGFNKTGTTTLQGQFFPALSDTVVIGPRNPGFDRFLPLARELCWADDGEYSDASLRARFASSRNGFGRLVVSLEDFSYWHHRGRTAQRLHGLLPDAKVLIGVRDQRTLLFSRYGGWLKKGGPFGFERFLDKLDPTWLDYDDVVECYQRRFGVERVKVVPYELLAADSARYLGEVRAFVAPDEPPPVEEITPGVANRGLAPPTRRAVRAANRLFVRSVDNPHPPLVRIPRASGLPGALKRWDTRLFPNMSRRPRHHDLKVADRYAARYAEHNSRLEQLAKLSLAGYGYPLADRSDARRV